MRRAPRRRWEAPTSRAVAAAVRSPAPPSIANRRIRSPGSRSWRRPRPRTIRRHASTPCLRGRRWSRSPILAALADQPAPGVQQALGVLPGPAAQGHRQPRQHLPLLWHLPARPGRQALARSRRRVSRRHDSARRCRRPAGTHRPSGTRGSCPPTRYPHLRALSMPRPPSSRRCRLQTRVDARVLLSSLTPLVVAGARRVDQMAEGDSRRQSRMVPRGCGCLGADSSHVSRRTSRKGYPG